MTDQSKPRSVTVRRTLTLGTVLAGVAATGAAAAGERGSAVATDQAQIILAQAQAQAEGEGEGVASGGEGEDEGESEARAGLADPQQRLQRDLSFMEGHLRAGLALYEAGDQDAARTHMGHPIKEKYAAVADPLAAMDKGAMRDRIVAIAEAAESGAPLDEVRAAFDAARAMMEEVRATMSPADQVMGLAALTRVAGAEYTVAVAGGEVSNLHEYQDAWGFLRVVETEARQMADSTDAGISAAGRDILDHLKATDAAFGDLRGGGDFTMDPSILMGAAARIELTGLGLQG
ncbi:hypothetical protein [Roseovarius ramblicola]|uniref:Uncharacterized protein n=1 Tax=Roseovarius ramblicola TaxID=2022336 RepID=A0ABV5HWM4_9RHOB